jgi:hypothetical protein
MTSSTSSTRSFVLVSLFVAVVIGSGLAYLAAGDPDGLESAIIKTQCADAPDAGECLDEAAGEPAVVVAPGPLDDYGVTWLSGIVGAAITFLAGAGLVALVRSGRAGRERERDEAPTAR